MCDKNEPYFVSQAFSNYQGTRSQGNRVRNTQYIQEPAFYDAGEAGSWTRFINNSLGFTKQNVTVIPVWCSSEYRCGGDTRSASAKESGGGGNHVGPFVELLGVFAIKSLKVGDELLMDYGYSKSGATPGCRDGRTKNAKI